MAVTHKQRTTLQHAKPLSAFVMFRSRESGLHKSCNFCSRMFHFSTGLTRCTSSRAGSFCFLPVQSGSARIVLKTQLMNVSWNRQLCSLPSAASHIDLRSDTVTKPSQRMRERMSTAQVGDDVYGEDPSVKQIESQFAELLGKEAAILVPSGTMANLVAVLSHTGRGDQVILGAKSHLYQWEAGHLASLASCVMNPLPNKEDGTIDLDDIERSVLPDDPHCARSRLVALENTHGDLGGAAVPAAYIDAVGRLCGRHGLALHIDGARLLNAAVALNETPARLAAGADSVSVCLSKGLGAPVGSILVGSEALMHLARRWRKAVGGAMRQSGVLAAAGLEALERYPAQLAADHHKANLLRTGLGSIEGVTLHTPPRPTNMVVFTVQAMAAEAFCAAMHAKGVLIAPFPWAVGDFRIGRYGGGREEIRAVLHCDVSPEDVAMAVECAAAVLKERGSQ